MPSRTQQTSKTARKQTAPAQLEKKIKQADDMVVIKCDDAFDLSTLRREKGKTLAAVWKESGVPYVKIRDTENGLMPPLHRNEVHGLAKALGLGDRQIARHCVPADSVRRGRRRAAASK